MIEFLFDVFLSYLIVYILFTLLRSKFKILKKIIFCTVCFTFFSIFMLVFIYYLFYGIQLLPIAYLIGCSVTGTATDLVLNSDRNRKEKQKIKDVPYSNLKEIIYQNRFFLIELGLFLVGLIFLEVFKLF